MRKTGKPERRRIPGSTTRVRAWLRRERWLRSVGGAAEPGDRLAEGLQHGVSVVRPEIVVSMASVVPIRKLRGDLDDIVSCLHDVLTPHPVVLVSHCLSAVGQVRCNSE